METIKEIIGKVLDRAKSSRVWATVAGNVFGIETVHGDWPRAVVIIAVNAAYVASETYLKVKGK